MLWLNFLQILMSEYERRMRNGERELVSRYGELCKAAMELDQRARELVDEYLLET